MLAGAHARPDISEISGGRSDGLQQLRTITLGEPRTPSAERIKIVGAVNREQGEEKAWRWWAKYSTQLFGQGDKSLKGTGKKKTNY